MDKIDIFPWNNNFNTGLRIVDEQHQKLVDIINRLAAKFSFDPKSIDLSTVFDELLAYTHYHFETEEAIWESYLDDKSILTHHNTHTTFIDKVKVFIEKQKGNSIEVTSENILNFLVKWLVTHILESDRHLAYRVAAIESGYSLDESINIATEKMSGHTREMIDIIIQIYDSFSHTTLHLMRELETRQNIEEKVNHQDHYRDLLLELSTDFINLPLDEIDHNINKALEKMANFVGADRAYICDYDFKVQTATNTYEWCAEDIIPQIDELQNISMSFVPGWPEMHAKGEYVLIQDISTLDEGPLRDILFPQKIQSLVTVPLFENSQCKGFVGFDAVKIKHNFSESEISILELFSKLLGNIAERKHKEEALFLSNKRFELSEKVGNIGSWEYIIQTDELWGSEQAKAIYGVPNKGSTFSLELIESCIPEKERTHKALIDLLEKDAEYNIEFKINPIDGSPAKIISAIAEVERDENGVALKVIGSVQDITEQKKFELQIAESEKDLRDVFDNAQSGLMYITEDRTIIKSNQRLADILGYDDPKEMLGFSMRKLHLSEENYIEYGKIHFDTLRMGVKRYIEYELLRKDGSSIWCELSGKTIDDNIPADMSKGILWTINDISQRMELKKVQSSLQERLSYAIEGSNDGLWDWNIQTNEIYFSPRWKAILGYADDELRNNLSTWETLLHPDDGKLSWIEFERFLASQDSKDRLNINFRMHHKDGHYVPILSRAKKVFNNKSEAVRLVGTHVDMTELYAVQEDYKQERDRSELYLNTAEVLLVALDINGRVTMLNRKGEELLGYKEEELLGKAWFEVGVLPKDVAIKVKSFFSALMQMHEAPKEEFHHHLITKSGKELLFSFHSSLLFNNEKKCIGLLSSAIDITELKQKDELMISQSRHAAMGEMISMIAHQWRQPLSVISMEANNMLLDIALDNFDSIVSKKYANSIIEHTQHLSKTIDDFKNFFKPDKKIVKVNIKDTLEQSLSLMQDSLKNNNIELKITFETDKEVDTYPRELMQVLVNIITNAKDALVHNKIKNAQINIRVYEDEAYINTAICDNGGGIDADILPKVFDPYFSTKNEKNGVGLGLYMSKMIIENHLNGVIEIDNNDDGVCCTVRLLKVDIPRDK